MHTLPETLVVRPVTVDDLEEVVELITTSLRAKNTEPNVSVASLRQIWQQIDLETCTWAIVTHLGKIVAFASLDARVPSLMRVLLAVDPEHDQEGMEAFLMRILEDHAGVLLKDLPTDEPAILQRRVNINAAETGNQASQAYLDKAGFQLTKHFWQMEITLSAPPTRPVWLPEISLKPFQKGQDEEAALQVFAESFKGQGEAEVAHVTRLSRVAMADTTLDRSMWYLVTVNREIAGAEFCDVEGEKGWVHLIGVLPAWRRKGLAKALLQQAFYDFYQRGIRQIALGVDMKNPDGAIELYQNSGMHLAQHLLIYEKVLKPVDQTA